MLETKAHFKKLKYHKHSVNGVKDFTEGTGLHSKQESFKFLIGKTKRQIGEFKREFNNDISKWNDDEIKYLKISLDKQINNVEKCLEILK